MSALLQREWQLEDEAKGRVVDPLSHEGDVAGTIAYVRALEAKAAKARELAKTALIGRWVRHKRGKYAGYVGQIESVGLQSTGELVFLAPPRHLGNPAEKFWTHPDARSFRPLEHLELLPRSFTGEDTSRKSATR